MDLGKKLGMGEPRRLSCGTDRSGVIRKPGPWGLVAMVLLSGCVQLAPVVPGPLPPDGSQASGKPGTPRSAARATPEYEQRWYCFENLEIQDDSGCGTSLVACKNLAKIRGDEYERFGVPFAASECVPFADPVCYHFRDSDTKYTRYMCHKTESSCSRSYELMELEAVSACGHVSNARTPSPAPRPAVPNPSAIASSTTR